MPEFTGQRDLRAYLRMIWRWKLLIIVILVAAPGVAFLLEHGKPKIYQSTAEVSVNTGESNNNSTDNVDTIAALVKTTNVADLAGKLIKPTAPGSSIVGEVTATANQTTGLLDITVTDRSPTRAAALANAFATAIGKNQHAQLVNQTQTAITTLRAEEKGHGRNSSAYQQLENQIEQDQIQLASEGVGAETVETATPNYTPAGPHIRRTVELGFVIGLLLAFALVLVLESADRRLRTPDELEDLTKLPLLAAIPPSAFSGELDTGPADDESFQMLRTSLMYFSFDEPMRSVLVTSPGEREGKSTVAGRLAIAAANAGMDVILVDADLRRAGTTQKLGLTRQIGLSSVLGEARPVEGSLVDWPLPIEGTGRLRVLPAGSPPPNPAALISSNAMRSLISSLESQCDLLIIDSPAALAVSDAVPLLTAVRGVIMLARMNQTKRETVSRLQKIITSAHGQLLGVVATGVRSGPGYEKYSQEYYAATTTATKRGWRGRKGPGSPTVADQRQQAPAPAQQPDDPSAASAGLSQRDV
jgi:capsular exopolysaccharide synthesis family protein